MKRTFYFAGIILLAFLSGNLFAQKTETSKYDNGKLEYKIQYDANGDEHGRWEYYYDNGQLEMVETYNHGWPSGVWETYYENGQLESKGNYNSEGYENDIWEAYFENGQIQYKGEYKNGKPTGDWKIFFEDGSLEASLSFSETGNPTGQIISNFNNEKPKAIGSFNIMGQKTGIWKIFYTNGALKSEIVYNNNQISEIKSAFDENGNQLKFSKTTDGPLKGQWFDMEGDNIEEIDYHAVMHVVAF